MRKTLAVAGLAVTLAACGTQHPAHPAHTPRAPPSPVAAAPSPAPASPFASWSPVCQRVAADMEAAGYACTGNGNWGAPTVGLVTYGQLQELGSRFAHLSYVEMKGTAGAQTASDLGNAGVGFFKFLPPSAYINSVYRRLLHKPASRDALDDWDQQYVNAIINGCATGVAEAVRHRQLIAPELGVLQAGNTTAS